MPHDDKKSALEGKGCPHQSSCGVYNLFTVAGTLTVWKITYCSSDFSRCARYQMSLKGQRVPINLMPNGNLLKSGEQR